MKHPFYKGLVAATALAMAGSFVACGEDTPSNPNDPVISDVCAYVVVTSTAYVIPAGGSSWVVYPNGSVTDGRGTPVGSFDGAAIYDLQGALVMNVTSAMLNNVCQANATITPGGEIIPTSSSTPVVGPGGIQSSSSTPVVGPGGIQSSGSTPIVGPGGETPVSSSTVPSNPELDENGFPTLESYGPPSPEYTKDISATAKRGWNTRYWDACKPHCSWISDGDKGRTDTTTNESYVAGLTTARNCNIHDVEIPTFTLGNVTKYWFGYEGTSSACENSNAGGAFTCTDMAPIAVNDTLSYGYVAGTADGKCGKCYHLQYDGHFEAESENNKPKETHQALKGKHMIVMASNIGMDVAGGNDKLPAGQFDLMVPGGGVGAFDALSTQVNGRNIEWGAGFGGFLTYCQQQSGYDAPMATYQKCVKDMCDAAFGNAGLPNLLRGCHWFADWFMAADNPTYYIEEVECPQYLMDHYLTRINTTKDNNYKKVTDWSNFKEGDVLDTLHCWKAGEGPADENGWANPNAGCDVQ